MEQKINECIDKKQDTKCWITRVLDTLLVGIPLYYSEDGSNIEECTIHDICRCPLYNSVKEIELVFFDRVDNELKEVSRNYFKPDVIKYLFKTVDDVKQNRNIEYIW